METLDIAKELQKAGINTDSAYKIATKETINGKSGLATKEDIHLLKKDMSDLRTELKEDISDSF